MPQFERGDGMLLACAIDLISMIPLPSVAAVYSYLTRPHIVKQLFRLHSMSQPGVVFFLLSTVFEM